MFGLLALHKNTGYETYGVPTNEFRRMVVRESWPETPKSHNFTSPFSVSKIFAADEEKEARSSVRKDEKRKGKKKVEEKKTFDITVYNFT